MRYREPTGTDRPPSIPVLLYDDTCPFCTVVARFVHRHAREPIAILPVRAAGGHGWLRDLDEREVAASAHLVLPSGLEYHGGESMSRALRLLPGGRIAAVLDRRGVTLLRDAGYALIARLRPLLSRVLHP